MFRSEKNRKSKAPTTTCVNKQETPEAGFPFLCICGSNASLQIQKKVSKTWSGASQKCHFLLFLSKTLDLVYVFSTESSLFISLDDGWRHGQWNLYRCFSRVFSIIVTTKFHLIWNDDFLDNFCVEKLLPSDFCRYFEEIESQKQLKIVHINWFLRMGNVVSESAQLNFSYNVRWQQKKGKPNTKSPDARIEHEPDSGPRGGHRINVVLFSLLSQNIQVCWLAHAGMCCSGCPLHGLRCMGTPGVVAVFVYL